MRKVSGAAHQVLPLDPPDVEPLLVVDWYCLDVLDNGGGRRREIYALADAPCPTFADVRREHTAADRLLLTR